MPVILVLACAVGMVASVVMGVDSLMHGQILATIGFAIAVMVLHAAIHAIIDFNE